MCGRVMRGVHTHLKSVAPPVAVMPAVARAQERGAGQGPREDSQQDPRQGSHYPGHGLRQQNCVLLWYSRHI
jgi:hypothetical protein